MEYTKVVDLDGDEWTIYDAHLQAEHTVKLYDKHRDRIIGKQIHFHLANGLVIKVAGK